MRLILKSDLISLLRLIDFLMMVTAAADGLGQADLFRDLQICTSIIIPSSRPQAGWLQKVSGRMSDAV